MAAARSREPSQVAGDTPVAFDGPAAPAAVAAAAAAAAAILSPSSRITRPTSTWGNTGKDSNWTPHTGQCVGVGLSHPIEDELHVCMTNVLPKRAIVNASCMLAGFRAACHACNDVMHERVRHGPAVVGAR
jgi:hypothetical protein